MKRFVCYIGCAALVFKLMYGAAWAAGATAGDTATPENGGAAVSAVRDTVSGTAAAAVSAGTAAAVGGESIVYRVRDLTAAASGGDAGSGEMGSGDTGSESETPEPIIRSDNELAKLALLPFIVDKVFAGEALDGDLTGFLSRVYPTAGEGTLKTLESGIRFFVSWKRKYDYAVARLKHNIKAAGILPKDAPIVAEDGEFAPEETDLRKQSAAGEYQVRYRPYKYLEYDPGALGEPVRRRDKNYISPEDLNTDEMVLALLELDFGGFWRALRKMPSYSDGAGEKPVEAGGGVKARLLLDTARPGDKETIRGVAEIYVPDGMYVSGDLLNPENRAAFVLREDGGSGGSGTGNMGGTSGTGGMGSTSGTGNMGSRNIKSFRMYAPLANGVEKGGVARRVLTGHIRFPLEFTRADTGKAMHIAGDLHFKLCTADGTCQAAATHHGLTLRASDKAEDSIHYNYVTQGFAHLPPAESRHARAEKLVYDREKGTLTATFALSRRVSNMAAMAEDAAGTNFVNPRYELGDGYARVTFDVRAGKRAGEKAGKRAGKQAGEQGRSAFDARSGSGENAGYGAAEAAVAGGSVADGTGRNTELPLQEVALSASFDDSEVLRTVMTVAAVPAAQATGEVVPAAQATGAVVPAAQATGAVVTPRATEAVVAPRATGGTLFAYGLLLNLMPGIFGLFLRLARQLRERAERRRIFCRYAAGAALGLVLLGIGYRGAYFGALYYNPWLAAGAAAVILPLWAEALGYMDFALFRPLKKIFRRGWLAGLFTVLLAAAFPTVLKAEALSGLFAGGAEIWSGAAEGSFAAGTEFLRGTAGSLVQAAGGVWLAPAWAELTAGLGCIWLGIMVLPLAVLTAAELWGQRAAAWLRVPVLRRFNAFYTGVYAAGLLWLTAGCFGGAAALGLTAGLVLLFVLWYAFPQAVAETIKHTRSEKRSLELFNRVQRHWLFAAAVWYLLAAGGLALAGAGAGTGKGIGVAEKGGTGIGMAENSGTDVGMAEKGSAAVPVLVSIEAPYSPLSVYNRLALRELQKAGLRVVRINAGEMNVPGAAWPWFAAYGKFYAPLTVLFTDRHKNGMVLPERLDRVDFDKALAGWRE
ncbi:MAG: hypothetical protein KIC51_03705 [Acetobacter sp.]|nr:hypothetical protein [Acetobacter sp.]